MKRKYGKNVNMNGRGTEPQVCMTKIVITAHIVNYGEMGTCTNNYFLSEIRKTSHSLFFFICVESQNKIMFWWLLKKLKLFFTITTTITTFK
jgi:hypothetical protein